MIHHALAATAAMPLFAMSPPSTAQSDLIPRKHIFGNPTRTSATISPDGRQLAFLAPRNGVLNVWVAPVNAIDQGKPVTADTVRPIRSFFWSPDSTRILYVQDKGGNENWLLYGVELATGKQTTYTDFDKTQVRVVNVSPKVPGSILVGINNRNPQFHDVHRLDLATGQLTLVRENNDYVGFKADWDHNLVFGQRQIAGGAFAVDRLDRDGKAKPWATIPADDNLTTEHPFDDGRRQDALHDRQPRPRHRRARRRRPRDRQTGGPSGAATRPTWVA